MAKMSWQEQCGSYAFALVGKMVGGHKAYFQSEQTVAMVWVECHSNESIQSLVGMYLVGSSERAEHNLNRLREKLVSVFGLEVLV